MGATKQSEFRDAVAHYESQTSLDFVEVDSSYTGDHIWVRANDTSLYGCYSYLGRIGGAQELQVGRSSCGFGPMVHEIGHALGLIHEHQRSDRDAYVNVYESGSNWDAMDPAEAANFGDYDITSIMHYCTGQGAIYAENGSTIPCNHTVLMDSDVRGVQIMYGSEFQPSIATTSWSNRADVFVRATDGAVKYRTLSGSTWGPWSSLGGVILGGPAAISRGTNSIDVFARDTNRALRWKHYGGAWDANWANLGGTITAQPIAVATSSSRMDVFGRGTSGQILHKWWNGSSWQPSQSGWNTFGGETIGPMVAVSRASNTIDLFVVDTNRGLQVRSWNGSSWSGWTNLGGYVVGMPAVAARTSTRLDVVVKGKTGTLWHKFWDGAAWSSNWASIGATAIHGNPEFVRRFSDRADLFYQRASDRALILRGLTSGWTGEASLAGEIVGTPEATTWASNRLDVFVRGDNDAVFHKWWNGSTWSPSQTGSYEALGGVASW